MVIEVSGMYFFFWNHKHDFEIKEHDAQTLFTINYIALNVAIAKFNHPNTTYHSVQIPHCPYSSTTRK